MKFTISKKILCTTILPILIINIISAIAISGSLFTRNNNEMKEKLSVATFCFKTEYELMSDDEMLDIMNRFKTDHGIDVTIFNGDERKLSTIENAVGTKMDGEILNVVKSGDTYYSKEANVNGVKYYGYYMPIMKNGKYMACAFTGMPKDEVLNDIYKNIYQTLSIILLVSISATIIVIILVISMTKSINSLKGTVKQLSDNNLSKINSKYKKPKDDLQELCNGTISFTENLKKFLLKTNDYSTTLKLIANNLKHVGEVATSTSKEISDVVEEVSKGAMSQAEETENATMKIKHISSNLENITNDVNSLKEISSSMNLSKESALNAFSELNTINAEMSSDIENTSKQVDITTQNIDRIKSVITVIRGIASQTNLLSLNASIEAARAGEQGNGFSVVANEIRNLSNASAQSSDEISAILEELNQNYELIVKNVEETNKNMLIQNNKVIETQTMFNNMETGINDTIEMISNIEQMVISINDEIKTMVDVISNLSSISEENSAATQETLASLEELNDSIEQIYEKSINIDTSANELMSNLKTFKL